MRFSILFQFCLFLVIVTSCKNVSTIEKKPNILFIMSDDHTSQAWGIYGGILEDYVQNNNIKRLANEGATLKNVFCTNSICVPSRATILTGQYSHENGVYTLNNAIDTTKHTVAHAMQKLGYETAIIGKWHLKTIPQGFDHVEVLPGQGRYHNPIFRKPSNWNTQSEWEEFSGFSTDVIAEKSLDWLENRTKDQPFFLMTHFKATHEPFDYPGRMADLYENEMIPEPTSIWNFEERSFKGQQLEILGRRYENPRNINTYPGLPVDFEPKENERRRSEIYQKFIKDFMRSGAAIDENIGRLLDYLDENNLAENTIVIYTSDQGYFLGEHGFFDKRIMYEEALRMPFVIRYPKEIRGGSEVEEMILNNDFASLFLDYAGSSESSFGSGRSFRKLLKGGVMEDWRKEMYYRYWQHLDIRPAHYGIRTDRYKLIHFYGKALGMAGAMPDGTEPFWEFYDLKKDPSELRNAIANPQYKSVVDSIKIQLLNLQMEVGDRAPE